MVNEPRCDGGGDRGAVGNGALKNIACGGTERVRSTFKVSIAQGICVQS